MRDYSVAQHNPSFPHLMEPDFVSHSKNPLKITSRDLQTMQFTLTISQCDSWPDARTTNVRRSESFKFAIVKLRVFFGVATQCRHVKFIWTFQINVLLVCKGD